MFWDALNQDNSGPLGPTLPAVRSPSDYAACQAYVAKYRSKFGHDPGIQCGSPPVAGYPAPSPPVIPLPPVFQSPIPPPAPPLTQGPVRAWRPRRMPRPVIRRPYSAPEERRPVQRSSGELCPVSGHVSRDIRGAGEYQVFACTPGQPVVIDPGLQAVGRREALARHGLSGLGFVVGNIDVPDWLPLVAIAALGVFVFMKRR